MLDVLTVVSWMTGYFWDCGGCPGGCAPPFIFRRSIRTCIAAVWFGVSPIFLFLRRACFIFSRARKWTEEQQRSRTGARLKVVDVAGNHKRRWMHWIWYNQPAKLIWAWPPPGSFLFPCSCVRLWVRGFVVVAMGNYREKSSRAETPTHFSWQWEQNIPRPTD